MSVAAPGSFTITGGASLTITVNTWQASAPTTSAITVNGHSHVLGEVFDNPLGILNELAAAGSVSLQVAEKLLQQLQFIVQMYDLQASESAGVPFNIVLA